MGGVLQRKRPDAASHHPQPRRLTGRGSRRSFVRSATHDDSNARNHSEVEWKLWPAPFARAICGVLISLRQLMRRSDEHTSELQSLMRISNAVFCSKKKKKLYQ